MTAGTSEGAENGPLSVLPAAMPAISVVSSFSNRPLPLDLGTPMSLRGGSSLHPDGVFTQAALAWAPGLHQLVGRSCMRQARHGEPFFHMQPSVVSAPEGTGRTLMVRIIARHADLPFVSFRACDLVGPPLNGAYSNVALPSPVVLFMAAAQCANPLILVTDIDDADDNTVEQLRRLVDPTFNCRWVDESLAATVDLSQVTWILQSSAAQGPPRRLCRAAEEIVVDLEAPGAKSLRLLSIVDEALAALGVDPLSIGNALAEILAVLDEYANLPAAQI